MSEVTVLTTTASSLDKLGRDLDRVLGGYSADDVLAISHSADVPSTKRTGGIWGPANQAQRLEYSAIILVRGS